MHAYVYTHQCAPTGIIMHIHVPLNIHIYASMHRHTHTLIVDYISHEHVLMVPIQMYWLACKDPIYGPQRGGADGPNDMLSTWSPRAASQQPFPVGFGYGRSRLVGCVGAVSEVRVFQTPASCLQLKALMDR